MNTNAENELTTLSSPARVIAEIHILDVIVISILALMFAVLAVLALCHEIRVRVKRFREILAEIERAESEVSKPEKITDDAELKAFKRFKKNLDRIEKQQEDW